MPLVNAKCTNCGANLEVDNMKEAAICQYCGSAYIVEKAINNYNTVNHIYADVVNIYSRESADFVIRGGVLEKYIGAALCVEIPESVRVIGFRAFAGTYVERVSIPDTVREIGKEAFANCPELREIHIPDGVNEIAAYTFRDCSALCKVVLPKNLKRINENAFANCGNLVSINVPKSIEFIAGENAWYMDNHAFANCENLVDVSFENLDTAERFCQAFIKSPIVCEIIEKRKAEDVNMRRSRGVCDFCGNAFKGVFVKKCTVCGRKKQY